ncbi:MAG: DUF5652 family protein [Patescibacteria group bacterium]
MDFSSLSQIPTAWFFVLYLWSILWKGLALWRAAELKQRNWFVAILVLNTVGILEIAYLFFFAKKKLELKELKFWETK